MIILTNEKADLRCINDKNNANVISIVCLEVVLC